ncbi:glycosyltransferase family 15 protein [Dendrothele bispora CBS 962.96]|uniref:Glycosyltransferase family 15 protein n=1 Tax=Dendrothele bispora (strain CBS 962.96) TaxID=1314807 RepID=A0A4V4HCQ2_DENBC|nr:glycosyltransferase family 15 protein [Dendrothele bispora CBS 962.96]
MNLTMRYILIVLGVIITLHYILTLTHSSYSEATSLSSLTSHFRGGSSSADEDKSAYDTRPLLNLDPDVYNNGTLVHDPRANATFVVLARNTDVDGMVRSVREMEDRFNRHWRYPYVFLNDVEWEEEVKERLRVLTTAKMEFGVIPKSDWVQPDWIDEEKATTGRNKLVEEGVIYGGSVSYRNMCRFNSGFFFRHPLVQKYRWYWRLDSDVHFHCDINFDPFLYMEEKEKVYAFTITMYEFEKTIPTLWEETMKFAKLHPEYIAEDNAMGFVSENGGSTYNLCHFWSNFEIADMDFWRSEAYMDYFDYLDKKGGFYYERWGDAPVHSLAAALFLPKWKIQFFDEIGYEHNPYTHCPQKEETWRKGRCSCSRQRSFDYDGYSCMSKWDRIQ